jgi:hypothetical protein
MTNNEVTGLAIAIVHGFPVGDEKSVWGSMRKECAKQHTDEILEGDSGLS